MGNLTRVISLMKTHTLSLCCHQLWASKLVVGLSECLQPFWDVDWPDVVQGLCMSSEPLLSSCVQWSSYVRKILFSSKNLLPLTFTVFLFPFPQWPMTFGVGNVLYILHLILCMLTSCSICINCYLLLQKNCLQWRLRDAVIHGY